MRVIIDARVFPNSTPRRLSVLCDHGIARRHRLQVEDRDSPEFAGWLDSLEDWQRVDWWTALDLGSRDDGFEPSRIEIRIVADHASVWSAECPSLTLEDALGLLGEKFQVVLEGDAEDRAFLLSMSSAEQKRFFLDCEQGRRCLEFVPGGGVESMIKKAELDNDRPGFAYGRRWYLFDSDALRPNEPSQQSEKLRRACGSDIPHLQLRRRAIENYIPKEALRNWAYSLPPRTRGTRAARFVALLRLTDDQRHYFNMKDGFKKPRDQGVEDDIYGDVSKKDRDILRNGFGKDIATIFQEGVDREHLERDGGWFEVNPAVVELVALVR